MNKKIEKLTKEQEKQIPEYIEKFVKLAQKPTDRKKATLAVKALYKNAGQKEPIVIFAQSPFSAIIMVVLCRILSKNELPKDDSQLRSQLYSQLGSVNNNWWIIIWWLTWAGWYAFGEYIGVTFDKNIFKIFMDFVMNVSFIIPYEGIAFVSETPEIIHWENKRLHNITGAAVSYKDGYSLYSIHGIRFEKELWEKVTKKTISPKELMSITNIEQRMAALKVVGIEYIFEETNVELLDRVKGYYLYKLEGVFSQPAYYLKYKDPSTERVYLSGIDPKIGKEKDAIKALRWKFSLGEDEYFSQES